MAPTPQRSSGFWTWREDTPFSANNVPNGVGERELADALDALGLRRCPAPYDRMLAIANDCDGATPEEVVRYTDKLAVDAWLDFGDSRFLYSDHHEPVFVDPNPTSDVAGDLVDAVHQYHLGRFDHLHGPLKRGGRLLEGRDLTVHDDAIECTLFDAVAPGGVARGRLARCVLRLDDDRNARLPDTVRLTAGEVDIEFVARHRRPNAMVYTCEPVELVWETPRVRLAFPDGAAGLHAVTGFFLGSTSIAEAMVDLADLRDRFHAEFSSITAHSGFLFYNEKSLDYHRGRRKVAEPATNGFEADFVYAGDDRPFVEFTVDDPASLNHVSTTELRSVGVRFVNPAGATAAPDRSFTFQRQVVPARTRDGGTLELFRRTLPRVDDHPRVEPWMLPGKTRRFTALLRLERLLEFLAAGEVAQFYTHLGSIDVPEEPEERRAAEDLLADESFDWLGPAGSHGLRAESGGRTFFTRTSALNRYCWMINHAARIMRRTTDGATVRFHADDFVDEFTGEPIRVTPNRLHGLSFAIAPHEQPELVLNGTRSDGVVVVRDGEDRWATVVGLGLRRPLLPARFPTGSVNGDRGWSYDSVRHHPLHVHVPAGGTVSIPIGSLAELEAATHAVIALDAPHDHARISLRWVDADGSTITLDLRANDRFENPMTSSTLHVPLDMLLARFRSVAEFRDTDFELVVSGDRVIELAIADAYTGKPHVGPELDDGMAVVCGLVTSDEPISITDDQGREFEALTNGEAYVVRLPIDGHYTARRADEIVGRFRATYDMTLDL